MKLKKIYHRDDLKGVVRHISRPFEEMSIPLRKLANYVDAGWEEVRCGKTRARVKRPWDIGDRLEHDCLRIMYNLGFSHISGEGGAELWISDETYDQLDVVAYDDDCCLVVECKSSGSPGRRLDMQAEIGQLVTNRDAVRKILNAQRKLAGKPKLKVGAILSCRNIRIREVDRSRARDNNVLILDNDAMNYYNKLSSYIGAGARFQLFGEAFSLQKIDGLSLKVPAVESTVGRDKVYTFSISPENLLKIAFVAHRLRNNIDSYQRMAVPTRLKKIRAFIDAGGVFPTSIVINFSRKGKRSALSFEPSPLEDGCPPGSRLGHLILPSLYQCAWVIDGQHRLLAYSGHELSTKASLTVTAFDGLDASRQAQLFVEINSKQKKVSAGHLTELFATLNWDASDPKLQVEAIVSQAIQEMRRDSGSVLFGRIVLADERRSDTKCITLKAVTDALRRPGLYIREENKGAVRQYGPLWNGDADSTLARTISILESWLSAIAAAAPDHWASGDSASGLAATNRGITACIRVLEQVLRWLGGKVQGLDVLPTEDLAAELEPLAEEVGNYFGSLTAIQINEIRQHYGSGAPAEIAFQIASHLFDKFENFDFQGLEDWKKDRASTDKEEAQRLVDRIEQRVSSHVIGMLKSTFGESESNWWPEVPLKVRTEAVVRREKDQQPHSNENYLMVIDYREIVHEHWQMFSPTLGFPEEGRKDARTKWIVTWNDIRNRAFHHGGARLKSGDVDKLRIIESELNDRGV